MTPPNPMIPGDHGIPPRRYRTAGPSLWPVLAGVVVAALFAVPYGAIAVLALLLVAVASFALLWAGYVQGYRNGENPNAFRDGFHEGEAIGRATSSARDYFAGWSDANAGRPYAGPIYRKDDAE